MRILLTGITGFAGGHLAESLLARPEGELFGVSRAASWPLDLRHLAGKVDLRACDLSTLPAVEAFLRDVQPEQIYHLAGYAHVGQSFRETEAAWAGNLTATLNLYEALVRTGLRPRVLAVGSALVYGTPATAEQVFDEETPLRPTSPYAASKAAADLAGFQYASAPGLDVVRVRPSNHIGPRQSDQFAVAHFAQQIAAIQSGKRLPLLKTGNLSPCRDLTDVRDMVEAYRLVMAHGRTGEVYNACSGAVHSMQSVLERLVACTGLHVEIQPDASLQRKVETPTICCDAGKLRRDTGWTPRIPLDTTLADILAYWRHRA